MKKKLECCQVNGESHLHNIKTGLVKHNQLGYKRAWKCLCGDVVWKRDKDLTKQFRKK